LSPHADFFSSEVAERLRVSQKTVPRLIETGELPAVRLGRKGAIRVDEAELEAFLYGDPPRPRHDLRVSPSRGGEPLASYAGFSFLI
jgi:excisionase family DNA binding protein